MFDFSLSALVVVIAGVVLAAVTQKLEKQKRMLLFAALAAKAVASIALMSITKYYYGYGDMLSYLREGNELVRYLDYSGWAGFKNAIAILFQQDVLIPVRILGIGRSAGSMSAISGLLLYFIRSDWAVTFVFAMVGFAGQVALCLTFWKELAEQHAKKAALACLFVPSLVFWSAGAVKETLAICGLGFFSLGLSALRRSAMLSSLSGLLFGILLIWLSKPFLVLALACAVAAAGYTHRAIRTDGRVSVRPVLVLAWALVGVVALLAIGEFLPKYSIANISEQVVEEQARFARVSGGSDFEVESYADRSAFEQFLMTPVAVGTSWFRPFVFEAKNAVMLINSLESTAFVFLFFSAIRRYGLRIVGRTFSSPVMIFAFVVACVLGVGVGLTTSNMGSLSRYRITMLPFFVLWLLIVQTKGDVLEKPRERAIGPDSSPRSGTAGAAW